MIKTGAVERLTESLGLRVTSTGRAIANFASACRRGRLDRNGNAQTTFIQCVTWGKPVEVLAKYTQKGSLTTVNDELQSRSYDDQQGQTYYATELVVAGFEPLESKETV